MRRLCLLYNFFQLGNHHIFITYFHKCEIVIDTSTLSLYFLGELNTCFFPCFSPRFFYTLFYFRTFFLIVILTFTLFLFRSSIYDGTVFYVFTSFFCFCVNTLFRKKKIYLYLYIHKLHYLAIIWRYGQFFS